MTPIPITAFALNSPDGARPTAYRSVPEGRPRAIVQIAHGMAEHFNRYRRLTRALTDAGYAVFGQDHRGHGASAAVHGLGDFGPGGFQSVVDDMAGLSRTAREAFPGAPLILLGHSMGSFAAQLYLLDHHEELAGLILSGTASVDALRAAVAAGEGAPSPDPLNAPFAPARTPFDWLSRDEAEVDAYIADPLCGFALTDEARRSVFATAAGAPNDHRLELVNKTLPILVISGEHDPVTGPGQAFAEAVISGYRAAGLNRIAHRVYPGGRHEMFNEINRQAVTRDLLAWLDGGAPAAG